MRILNTIQEATLLQVALYVLGLLSLYASVTICPSNPR